MKDVKGRYGILVWLNDQERLLYRYVCSAFLRPFFRCCHDEMKMDHMQVFRLGKVRHWVHRRYTQISSTTLSVKIFWRDAPEYTYGLHCGRGRPVSFIVSR